MRLRDSAILDIEDIIVRQMDIYSIEGKLNFISGGRIQNWEIENFRVDLDYQPANFDYYIQDFTSELGSELQDYLNEWSYYDVHIDVDRGTIFIGFTN